MYCDNLILEITRKCNMKCGHCLRGPAQNLNISNEVIWHSLSSFQSINCLSISGGEPSLATERIKEILYVLRARRISVNFFYCVTNGMTVRGFKDFLNTLNELYEYCDEKDSCSLHVSRDQFHQEFYNVQYHKFENEYGEYYPFFYKDGRQEYITKIITEGRAKNIGNCPKEEQSRWSISSDNDYVENEIYVSANGNVVSNCDLSYHRIDKEKIGNVLNMSMNEIIHSFADVRTE